MDPDDTFEFEINSIDNVFYSETTSLPTVKGNVLTGGEGDNLWFCIKDGFVKIYPKYIELSMTAADKEFESDVELDVDGKAWLQYEPNKWVMRDDVTSLSKNNLAQLGYKMLDSNADNYEKSVESEDGEEDTPTTSVLISHFLTELDINADGSFSEEEIQKAYKDREN